MVPNAGIWAWSIPRKGFPACQLGTMRRCSTLHRKSSGGHSPVPRAGERKSALSCLGVRTPTWVSARVFLTLCIMHKFKNGKAECPEKLNQNGQIKISSKNPSEYL